MLCAELLCELPLEVRILVARLDAEVYMRMYLYDDEFRCYANKENAIDDFIERFVVKQMCGYKIYKLGNVEYRIYDNGKQLWFTNGKLYRNNGPAKICANGDQYWINGNLHRLDGPAIICANGDQEWHVDGKCHRDDGPAITYANGYKAYYQDGKRHRLDGPAIIYVDGRKEYWKYGVRIK